MSKELHGIVKWFDAKKGYGFLSVEGMDDIFVHFSSITTDGFRSLEEGQRVVFTLAESPKGPHAIDVRPE